MQNLETKREQYIENLVTKVTKGDGRTLEQLDDYLMWGFYGQEVLSQFGLGLQGYVVRHNGSEIVMSIKVVESGIPLVAFVTSGTTIGCIQKFFDLLWANRLKWQKDKYPWI